MKKIDEKEVRRMIYEDYGVHGYDLFHEITEEERHQILVNVFEQFTNYRWMSQRGLVERKTKEPDVFDGYKDFTHVHTIGTLVFDMNQTVKASKDRVGRSRRKKFQKQKSEYQQKKQRDLASLKKKEYLEKWNPMDEIKKKRLKEIRSKRRSLNREDLDI